MRQMTIQEARDAAGDWHSGQWSALYSFASTGKKLYPNANYRQEVESCLPENKEESDRLKRLLGFLRRMKMEGKK